MYRTISQNRRLHQLFGKMNIDAETKKQLVSQFTKDRTERSSEMLYNECLNLIKTLENQNETEKSQRKFEQQYNSVEHKARRKLFSLMYDLGYLSKEDSNSRKLFIMNGWIKKKMNLDKKLNDLTIEELNRMNTQLQTVKRRYAEKETHTSSWN